MRRVDMSVLILFAGLSFAVFAQQPPMAPPSGMGMPQPLGMGQGTAPVAPAGASAPIPAPIALPRRLADIERQQFSRDAGGNRAATGGVAPAAASAPVSTPPVQSGVVTHPRPVGPQVEVLGIFGFDGKTHAIVDWDGYEEDLYAGKIVSGWKVVSVGQGAVNISKVCDAKPKKTCPAGVKTMAFRMRGGAASIQGAVNPAQMPPSAGVMPIPASALR